MTENDEQVFEEICRMFAADNGIEALRELRNLTSRVDDPWKKVELNYREIMFLVEMHDVSEARRRLEDLQSTLLTLIGSPCDSYEIGSRFSLPVMASHAEIRVTVEEGKGPEGLRLIETFVLRYPKQLSLPDFDSMVDEITTLRGFLLSGVGRWNEARDFLEDANPPEGWKAQHSFFLGRCYYEDKEYARARVKLSDALNLGLEPSSEGSAHYVLGLVEYHLADMKAAKREFELSLRTTDPAYLGENIWGWLEATSRALGLQSEADNYGRLNAGLPPKSKIN